MIDDSLNIGYIGLGLMGQPIALNLIKAGYQMNIYARRPENARLLIGAGATFFDTPRELASNCDIIFTNVSNTTDVEEVVLGDNGIIHGAKPGSIVIDMSTISPGATRNISTQLQVKQIDMLDAPVSGGPQGAQQGTLSIMVGGKQTVFDKLLPILNVIGKNIVYMGEHGAGQVTKACNQIIVAQTISAIGEAFILAKASGVDPIKVRQALLGGFASSPILEIHGQRMLDHKFVPGFKTKLHHKDMHIVMDAAKELGLSLPGTEAVTQYFDELVQQNHEELDSSALLLVLEKLNGVT